MLTDVMLPKIENVSSETNYGRYHVEPLEPGFGVTVGNALRRVLLSSLPGAAVTSIKIDNVYHEFSAIPGIREDTTELILNLKQVRLKTYADDPVNVRPADVRLPGLRAVTLINETCEYTFTHAPLRLEARSLAGTHDVRIGGA